MSVVGTVSAPAAEFQLGRALSVAGARIELERTVRADAPLTAWVWTDDAEEYLAELDARGVEGVHCEERVDGGLRCSVGDLTGGGPNLLDTFEESGLTVLSVCGDDQHWQFCVRTDTTGDLGRFRRTAADRSIPVEVSRQTTNDDGSVRAALTAIQRETLVAAYREGYYSTPRTATLADLAETFDVSPRAVSQRLRRGVGNLVEATLPVD